MTPSPHPGTITLVDEEEGTTRTVPAQGAPPHVAYVGGVPVVKVVKRRAGGVHELLSYGADGALLQTTRGT